MAASPLVYNLIEKVETLAGAQQSCQVLRVRVQLGRYTAIMPDHLRTHFAEASQGTCAAAALLDIIPRSNPADPLAYALTLESVEILEDGAAGHNVRLLHEDLYLEQNIW